MNDRTQAILDHLSALADTTRSRILMLLDRHELTVSELCAVLQLPQSTVSRHLKALSDGRWVAGRAEGTSHFYGMARDGLDVSARRLWLLVREQMESSPAAAEDRRRLQAALADRRSASQEFFSSSAGQWDRLRDELFGDRFHLAAFAALADRKWAVGDLGCGTGQVSAALAPFVSQVVAVDASPAMLQAARRRLSGFDNVDLRRGELEALPIEDAQLDAAILMLVLHYVPEPEGALADIARVLKPGGRALIVDMRPHDRESYRQQMGHVWLGFSDDHMRQMLTDAGFDEVDMVSLTSDARAKGPGLFVTTARKAGHHGNPKRRNPASAPTTAAGPEHGNGDADRRRHSPQPTPRGQTAKAQAPRAGPRRR
jgi:ubiquinone/menaquinone biosynthesis C-methylase UbiE/DNA-binding transcriptional ArsR family regulator